jgi:hypothetical protein
LILNCAILEVIRNLDFEAYLLVQYWRDLPRRLMLSYHHM